MDQINFTKYLNKKIEEMMIDKNEKEILQYIKNKE